MQQSVTPHIPATITKRTIRLLCTKGAFVICILLLVVFLYQTKFYRKEKYWACLPKESWENHFKEIFATNSPDDLSSEIIEKHLSCPVKFKNSFVENFQYIQDYSIFPKEEYLKVLSLDRISLQKQEAICRAPKSGYPVIVTAASSNHFLESQALIQNLHTNVFPLYKNITLIYYDIGLEKLQRESLELHCRCEVRKFPFEKFPNHIKQISNYAFKPVIIQLILKDHDFLMWMDTSIRMTGKGIQKLFLDTIDKGVQVSPGWDWSTVATGNKRTFDFLKEEPCLYPYVLMQPGWLLIVRSTFTLRALMKPWVSCALTFGCMEYPNSGKNLWCNSKKSHRFHVCHRFDQTVFNIILRRLFAEKCRYFQLDINTTGSIKRGDQIQYFPSNT